MPTIPHPDHTVLHWHDRVRHLFAHSNGEEHLMVEMSSSTTFESSWVSDVGKESLLAMGWSVVPGHQQHPLPEIVLGHVTARLAEERKPPSLTLSSIRL